MVERVSWSVFVYAAKSYRGRRNDVRHTVGIDSSELAVGNRQRKLSSDMLLERRAQREDGRIY